MYEGLHIFNYRLRGFTHQPPSWYCPAPPAGYDEELMTDPKVREGVSGGKGASVQQGLAGHDSLRGITYVDA